MSRTLKSMRVTWFTQDCYVSGLGTKPCLRLSVVKIWLTNDGEASTSRIYNPNSESFISDLKSNETHVYPLILKQINESLPAEIEKHRSDDYFKQQADAVLKKIDDHKDFIVENGQLTFDEEGEEGGLYHSRKPHVPSKESGLTIGRGYDLKEKKKDDVISDLREVGLTLEDATLYADAVGLSGDKAKDYIKTKKLVELTAKQQKTLFENVYHRIEEDVIRLCSKDDVVETYGKTNWQALKPKIKTLLIDLHFRGDYGPATRKYLQKSVVENDLSKFTKLISDKDFWKNVPTRRFEHRVNYIEHYPNLNTVTPAVENPQAVLGEASSSASSATITAAINHTLLSPPVASVPAGLLNDSNTNVEPSSEQAAASAASNTSVL